MISFVTLLVLARLVKPEAFGLVAYATVLTAFAEILIDQGFGDAIVQCIDLEREHLDTAFWISLGTGIALTVACISGSGIIAGLFNQPQLAPIVKWLSISFIFSGLSSVQQAILRRKLAFKSLALRTLLASVIGGAVGIVMAVLGFGVWSLVAKLLVANLVGVITLWQVSDWRPGLRASRKHFKELFSYGINIVGSNFVGFFSLHGDDFLIGYFLGPVLLGYYTLAYNLLIVMSDLLISVPNAVIFPTFSRLQSEFERMKQSFYEVTQLQSIVAFPVFLGISILAIEVVKVLYGETWVASIPVLRILMLIGIFRSATYFYSSVIKAVGKPSWRLVLWSLTAVLNIIGFFLVVRQGIVAVASVYVVISYAVLPLYFLVVKNLLKVSTGTHLRQYSPAFFSSLGMVCIILGLKYLLDSRISSLAGLLIYVPVGVMAYLFFLHLMQPKIIPQLLELAGLARSRLLARNA